MFNFKLLARLRIKYYFIGSSDNKVNELIAYLKIQVFLFVSIFAPKIIKRQKIRGRISVFDLSYTDLRILA